MTIGHGYKSCEDHLDNHEKVCMNFGSGFDKIKYHNWINVDCSKNVNPDRVWKAGKEKAPFKNNTFDFIYSKHSFEHVKNPVWVLEEWYRISKPGAVWEIIVPFGNDWQDNLFHQTMGFHKGSFRKFYVEHPRAYYAKVRIKPIRVWCEALGWNKYLPFKSILGRFLNNVWSQICYEFEVIK